ncbi:beta strand repeat-containing protein [Sediminicola luteus]|uniref:Uncharacterized protein n=1 Tax=Sediminicola luteus TaxID=319238 RepID=A0A2A4G4S7_9FLAO|nr:hypothetical protein [Sediminicola luteus]PCE63443.1 hypothetical protein B7P33_14620 [Sediminicola luteus]
MNVKPLLFGLCFVLFNFSWGQIKIGDNPQNLHPASVLELESLDRALVIPRVTEIQMQAIQPLHGALVYNTDSQCVHYYNGTAWTSLCSTVDANTTNVSLTMENNRLILTDSDDNTVDIGLVDINPGFTSDRSLVIEHDTANNSYDLKVGIIGSEHIIDGSLSSVDIGNGSITSEKINDLNITNEKLSQGAVTNEKIANTTITPIKMDPQGLPESVLMTNTNGTSVEWVARDVLISVETDGTTITGNGSVTNPIQLATSVSGQIANNSTNITNNTSAINTHITDDGDISASNETNTQFAVNGGNLEITDSQGTLGVALSDIGSDDQQIETFGFDAASNTLSLAVENDNQPVQTVDLSNFTGDGSITSTDLNVTGGANATLENVTLSIANDVITATKLNPDVAGTGLSQNIGNGSLEIAIDGVGLNNLANGNTNGQVMQWDGTDWVLVDDSTLDITETDGTIGNEVTNATAGGALTRNGMGTNADPYTLDISTDGVDRTRINANVAGTGLTQNANGSIEIDLDGVALTNIVNGTAVGQIMQWNGTDWVLVDDSTLDITETDGTIGNEVTNATAGGALTRNGMGTNADPYTLDISTDGVDRTRINANVAGTGLTQNADGSLEIDLDGVALTNIANGTAVGQIMQWNGTDWVLVDDSTLDITETDGTIGNEVTNATAGGALTRNGMGTNADPYTLDISTDGVDRTRINANVAGTGLTQNADGSIEIDLDGVALTNIANGTAVGQIMQWNGTDWVLVDDSTLDITETDGTIGNEVTNATAGGALTRNGMGTNVDPYTLDINTDGVDRTRINADVAGNGLIQNATTGALELDESLGTKNINSTGTLQIGATTINSSFTLPIRPVNSDIVVGNNDYTLILNPGVSQVTLPPANASIGRVINLKNLTGGNVNVIHPSTLNIFISSSGANITLIQINSTVTLQSDGTNWQQIN